MTMLSVVIPAYNEEDSIEAVARRVLSTRPRLAEAGVADLELIVVDDGSRDRTREIAAGMAEVRLLCHKSNGGYGAALKTGFAAARGAWIGFLDADGTYPPEYFPELCRIGIAHEADIVIGSRMAGAASEMPPMRRLGNFLFAHLVSLVAARRITDSASGMRVFKKGILDRIYPLPDGLNLTPVMSTRALHEGLKMVETPIPYSERQGRSKLSVVRDGWRFAQSIVWTALTYNPARLFGIVGGMMLLAAALIGILFIASRASGVTQLSPRGVFALFAAAVLTVTGVSVFTLGASFNYLVALFYKRPIRQGVFGKPLFREPLERHFGWMGLLTMLVAGLLGIGSLVLGVSGWPQERLWFWELLCATGLLVGLQLVISWFMMRTLAELNQRELRVTSDLAGREATETLATGSPATQSAVSVATLGSEGVARA